jgi:oligopeptide/dipeptide ABC transporter ATP-binding protein
LQEAKKILEIKHLYKKFPVKRPILDVALRKPKKSVKAVDDISLTIYEKEVVALVGESGCGKSSLARTLVRLYEPDSGNIIFDGKDVAHVKKRELKEMHRRIQMVFQDPYSSLNPRTLIGDVFRDELLYHKICKKDEVKAKTIEILQSVGMEKQMMRRFPNELSGGQRQRIGIARALTLRPQLLITDEPVSALDVSIQAQILNLLKSLQQEFSLTILFITHDLRVVQFLADRVAVMYLGKIVETGNTGEIYANPLHPYTDILIRSTPSLDPRVRQDKPLIEGNPPSPIDVPPGCRFCERCPKAKDVCFKEMPQLTDMGGGHLCACHFAKQIEQVTPNTNSKPT